MPYNSLICHNISRWQAEWNATSADDDVTRNNIEHGFLSTKDPSAAPGLEQLLRLFLVLMPDELHSFSVARSAPLNILHSPASSLFSLNLQMLHLL